MYIDFNALKADIEIEQVLELFGEEYSKRKSFKCVAKDHDDKSPSMAINHKNNTCHCFACNATFNPLSLTMEETGLSVYEAGKYLIEHLGLDRSVYAQETIFEDNEGERFPFAKEELALIGLKMNYSFSTIRANDTDVFFRIEREVREDAEECGMSEEAIKEEIRARERHAMTFFKRDQRISLVTMFTEDKEGFYGLIENASLNELEKVKENRAKIEKEFRKQKYALVHTDTKEYRDRVIKGYLSLIEDPIGCDMDTVNLLDDRRAKDILNKYMPLKETYQVMKEIDETESTIKGLMRRIPMGYRTVPLDEMLKAPEDGKEAGKQGIAEEPSKDEMEENER
jgi:hypothetical protein